MNSKLDREMILKALALLDDSLRRQETIGEICIFGGAAMKCLASRVGGYGERGDISDIRILCQHIGCDSPEQVMDIVLDYYPPAQVPAKTKFLTEEIFQTTESPAS